MILPQNKHYLLEALKEIAAIIESLPAKKSCNNCEHFDTGKCKISDYAAPPPQVIAIGCASWQFDGVPF
jgi:hypothetical protein